jgi:hypothetical protein
MQPYGAFVNCVVWLHPVVDVMEENREGLQGECEIYGSIEEPGVWDQIPKLQLYFRWLDIDLMSAGIL